MARAHLLQVPFHHPSCPALDQVRETGHFQIPEEWIPPLVSQIVAFRHEPGELAIEDTFGRIELLLETIEGFRYEDCPPHPLR